MSRHITCGRGLWRRATSDHPAAGVAVWPKARGASLTELVDVNDFAVIPGAQANWFIGPAAADQEGQDADGLARTWVPEMCASMHLDGHESALPSLRPVSRHDEASPTD